MIARDVRDQGDARANVVAAVRLDRGYACEAHLAPHDARHASAPHRHAGVWTYWSTRARRIASRRDADVPILTGDCGGRTHECYGKSRLSLLLAFLLQPGRAPRQ